MLLTENNKQSSIKKHEYIMKTQKQNLLQFKKKSILELSNQELKTINGGGFTLDSIDIITIITRNITDSVV
jgi:bacteriocin-like protein